ncbi:sensor histidine kinase [Actinocatenispora thailandica]|uniref:sensor histidine kinase n=1 Tax=Actinocatenispora thailandica TaxID=227318 RepID=UPI0031CDF0E3
MAVRPSRSMALLLLRRSEHVLFLGLLALGAAGTAGEPGWPVLLAGTVLVAGWYAAGVVLARRRGTRGLAIGWLAVLVAGCAALALGSASFVWLAFPLFLLATQLLPLAASVPVVAALTAGTIAVIAADRDRWDAAAVVGPVVGALVAVMITVVYRDLADQLRQRAELLDELTAAQDRLAASQRDAGVLAERERLAREIHDTITQSLTSIVLVLRTARQSAVTGGGPAVPEPLVDQLDTAIGAARGALADTRRLVRDLTPAELAGASLPDALRRIVADQPGDRTRLHVEGAPAPLPTPVAVTLLRTAQEALANARAHAAAGRVELTLTYLPDAVSLDVVDDGVGFDPARPLGGTSGTGLGIGGMRARADEVGGSLSIDTAPGRGTAVNLTVPRQEDVR